MPKIAFCSKYDNNAIGNLRILWALPALSDVSPRHDMPGMDPIALSPLAAR